MAKAAKTDLEVVIAALNNAESYPTESHPASARTMLVEGLPHALPAAGQEPHRFQREFISLAGGLLAEARKGATAALEACEAKSKEEEVQFQAAEKERSAAAESTATARADFEAKTAELRGLEEQAALAEVDLAGLEEARDAVLRGREELKGRRQAVSAVAAALEEWESGKSEKPPTAKVVAFLEEAKVEKALLAAAPSALAVRPAERKAFDNVAMEEISKIIEHSGADLDEKLAAGEPEERQALAEALGAWAILDVARDRVKEAKAALTAARRTLRDAEATEATALDAETTRREAQGEALAQQSQAAEKIKELDEAVAALERVSEPAPEATEASAEAMEVEAAAPAEAAATGA